MNSLDDRSTCPPEPEMTGGFGLRTAVLVAVVTIATAALLLGFGGW